MDSTDPRSEAPAHETAAEKKFRAEMRADGFSEDEIDAAITESRPAVAPLQAASDAAATGALGYGLGFLAFIPIPMVSLVIAGIVMAAVYPGQRRKSAIAAENSRRAANWGLTLIAGMLVMAVLTVISGTLWGDGTYGAIVALPLLLFPIFAIAHLIVIIVGLIRSSRRDVFRNPIAIPFLR